jgi:hypothetical protein
VFPSELNEVSCLFDHCALLWGGGDGDAPPAPELDEAFLAKDAESAEHGVGVDAEDGGKVAGRWEPFTGLGFTLGDRAADLGGGLLEERHRASVVELATKHETSYSSTIAITEQERTTPLLVGQPPTTSSTYPELLIEEAHQRHRRRVRLRVIVFALLVVLAALGVGIAQLVTSGRGIDAKQPPPAPFAADPKPAVIDAKVEVTTVISGRPVRRQTFEVWQATNAPETYREQLKLAGEPAVEIGAEPGHDKILGAEQIIYLYAASSNTIYRTGAYLPGLSIAPQPLPPLPLTRSFRHVLAHRGARLEGTRTLDGHNVYVVRSVSPQPGGADTQTIYYDTHTYLPILTVTTQPTLRITIRVLAWTTLPATKSNVKLTSLTTAHPNARVLPAPQRIKNIYFDTTDPLPSG